MRKALVFAGRIGALGGLAALIGASMAGEARSAPDRGSAVFTVVGGTWASGDRIIGPAFAYDTRDPSMGARVTGPGGFTHGLGGAGQHYGNTPIGRFLNWCRRPYCDHTWPGGQYTATDESGTSVSFSIAAGNRLGPVTIDRGSIVANSDRVVVRWTGPAAARSYLVYVSPASQDASVQPTVREAVVSGQANYSQMQGLSLDPGTLYQLNVFAFSGNITSFAPLQAPFNISSDRYDFVPRSTAPTAGPGFLRWCVDLSRATCNTPIRPNRLTSGTLVKMLCWRDGPRVEKGAYASRRWFYVYASGLEGFLHSSWVTNQVRTPNCNTINWMRATDWAIEQIGRVAPTDAQRRAINPAIVRWSGWCWAFVRGSWLLGAGEHIPGGATAVAAYRNYASRVVASGTAPRGTLLFWGHAPRNSAGHAALSLGNGQAVGTRGFERDSYPIERYAVSGGGQTSGGRPAYRGYAYP